MVREERLELSQVTPLEPKSSASTNSATLAHRANPVFNTKNFINTSSYRSLFFPFKSEQFHGLTALITNRATSRETWSAASLAAITPE
jgi:hypothetical protein